MFSLEKSRPWIALTLCLFLLAGGHSSARADEDKVISIVTEPWEPYLGPGLPNQGLLSELVKESFRRVGYTVKIDFMPWKRAVYNVRFGASDALLGAYHTIERARFLEYSSEALGEVKEGVFTKKERNIAFTTLEDLKGYRVGVVRGAAHSKEFDSALFSNKFDFTTREQSIKMLIADRVDLIAGPVDVVRYIIATKFSEHKDQIVAFGPTLKTSKVYISFSKKIPDYKKIAEDFDRGMSIIKKDGTFDQIVNKHSPNR